MNENGTQTQLSAQCGQFYFLSVVNVDEKLKNEFLRRTSFLFRILVKQYKHKHIFIE